MLLIIYRFVAGILLKKPLTKQSPTPTGIKNKT